MKTKKALDEEAFAVENAISKPRSYRADINMQNSYDYTKHLSTKLEHIGYRLKITVDRLEFQILEMAEQFRASGYNDDRFFDTQNGIKVRSCLAPSIHCLKQGRTIYLRGCFKEFDRRTYVLANESTEQLKAWEKAIHEALKDWDQNWEGWTE